MRSCVGVCVCVTLCRRYWHEMETLPVPNEITQISGCINIVGLWRTSTTIIIIDNSVCVCVCVCVCVIYR